MGRIVLTKEEKARRKAIKEEKAAINNYKAWLNIRISEALREEWREYIENNDVNGSEILREVIEKIIKRSKVA